MGAELSCAAIGDGRVAGCDRRGVIVSLWKSMGLEGDLGDEVDEDRA
jgi:hypothetical protein